MIVHLLIHLIGRSISLKANGCLVKRIHCERCGEEYIYQLRRTVSSSSYAVLHVGVEKKRQAVVKKVEAKLRRALENGVDVVGCPSCGWLQSSMVGAWRKAAFKKIAIAAAVLGVVLFSLWSASDVLDISAAALVWTSAICLAALTIAATYVFLSDRNAASHRRTREVLGHSCPAMPAAEFDTLLAGSATP